MAKSINTALLEGKVGCSSCQGKPSISIIITLDCKDLPKRPTTG